MNKEEAFEFISRFDFMHPKMKEACKVVEHELFRPKQEPPIINHKGLKEVMKFVVKKYVLFEGLVNPLVDHIMKTFQDHLDGLVYHFDYLVLSHHIKLVFFYHSALQVLLFLQK